MTYTHISIASVRVDTKPGTRKGAHIAMAQSDSRMPRKPYAWISKRLLAKRSFFTLRGGRESRPLSGGSKHMLNAGRTSVW